MSLAALFPSNASDLPITQLTTIQSALTLYTSQLYATLTLLQTTPFHRDLYLLCQTQTSSTILPFPAFPFRPEFLSITLTDLVLASTTILLMALAFLNVILSVQARVKKYSASSKAEREPLTNSFRLHFKKRVSFSDGTTDRRHSISPTDSIASSIGPEGLLDLHA